MTSPETPKKSKNTSMSKYFRGSSLLLSGRIFSIIIKFVIQLLFVWYLSKEDYGAFAYAISIVDICQILVLVALDKTGARYISVYREEERASSILGFIVLAIGTVLVLSVAVILFFAGTGDLLLGTLISDPLSLTLVITVIVLAPLQAFDNLLQGIFSAFGRVKAIFFRRYILSALIQLAVIILVIMTQSNVVWLATGYVIGGAIGTAIYFAMLYSMLRDEGLAEQFKLDNLDIQPVKIFGFSLPMFFTGMVYTIRAHSIVIFLEVVGGTVAVAEFRAVQPVLRFIAIAYSSFVYLYLPLASKLFAQNDDVGINDLYWRSSAWISIMTFPIFLVTFSLSQPVVDFILPSEYESSALLMSIMALGSYINVVMGFNKDTLRAYNKVRYLLFVDITVMVIALLFFALLIPPQGALGGAIAFSLVLIINNLLYHVGLVRLTGVSVFDPKYAMIYLLIIAGASGLMIVQMVFSLNIFVGLILAAIISLAVLRLSAPTLQIGETFPEMLKIPLLKHLIDV